MRNFLSRAFVAAFLLLTGGASFASQGSGCMPTSGTVSGLTLVQDINAANDAFISMNSGASAPSTACSAVPLKGQVWLDTTADLVKVYDGANWLILGKVDATNHVWTPRIGGGLGTLAAATSTDLGSIPQGTVTITGGTTIAGFSNTAEVGIIKLLRFSGTPLLTNSSSLLLPTGLDIQVSAGDQAAAVYLGGNVWSVWSYTRANGTAVATSSVFTGAIFLNAQITPTTLAANTNDWSPTSLAVSNVIRVAASSAINVTGLVAPATNGQQIIIYNIGAFNITLVNESSSSTAGNRFAFFRAFALLPGASVLIIYDSATARWRFAVEPAGQMVAAGYSNLVITNDPTNGTTLQNNMRITANALTVEDSNGRAFRLRNVSVSPAITASGADGLDTGSVAQGAWYFEYVIFNPATNAVAGLFSLQSSCSAVTLPSGYTACSRFGANYIENVGTKRFMRIVQRGNEAAYIVTPSSSTATLPYVLVAVPTLTPVDVSGFIPSTASFGCFELTSNTAVGLARLSSSASRSDTGSGATQAPVQLLSGGTSTQNVWAAGCIMMESMNVYMQMSSGTGYGYVNGWKDNL